MPELPEVETIVRDVRPALVGRRITAVRLGHRDVLKGVTGARLRAGLEGARVVGVTRRAKHAVVETDRRRLVIQPGMTGAMFVKRRLSADDRHYAVLQATLDDGRTFVYHDVRRLGTIRWLDDRGWARHADAIGPEPLDPSFTPEALGRALRASRAAIKKVLMDQKHVAGIGNIYANEALFAAGIDPSKAARKLRPDDLTRLQREVTRILAAAIEAEGTTVRDYRTGKGEPGSFQLELLVYGREGEPCRRCGTTLTGTHAIDARITVFCHRCQQ